MLLDSGISNSIGSYKNLALHDVLKSRFYIKRRRRGLLIVCVYVDDLLVTSSSLQLKVGFKREMRSKFEVSNLGKLTYYLGIKVRQCYGGIVLSEDRYAKKILEETGMHAFNLTHIPMEANVRLFKSPQERSIDER